MTGCEAALLHRRGCQAREADHIADRVDMGTAGLVMPVHTQAAAIIGVQTRGTQIELGRVAGAPEAVQRFFSHYLLAARKMNPNTLAVLVLDGLDAADLFGEAERDTILAELVRQRVDNLRIDEG